MLTLRATIALAVLALAGPAPAQSSLAPTTTPATPVVDDVREAWGDADTRRCIVCGIDRATAEHSELHRGTLIPVCEVCVTDYHADRARWVAEVQPRAALFHDDYDERASVRYGVFLAGLWLTVGLICGAAAGGIAVQRGHPAWPYVLAGVVGNVLGLAWALTRPRMDLPLAPVGLKVPSTRPPVPCPTCGRGNHPAASGCAGCGATLAASAPSEVSRPPES